MGLFGEHFARAAFGGGRRIGSTILPNGNRTDQTLMFVICLSMVMSILASFCHPIHAKIGSFGASQPSDGLLFN